MTLRDALARVVECESWESSAVFLSMPLRRQGTERLTSRVRFSAIASLSARNSLNRREVFLLPALHNVTSNSEQTVRQYHRVESVPPTKIFPEVF